MADNRMPFFDWVKQVNTANSGITTIPTSYPLETEIEKIKKQFKDTCYRNMYVRLFNIALKLFKWKVPDSIDPRIIEIGYLQRGQICVFRNEQGEFALPCIPMNLYNIYANPTQVQVIGWNGYVRNIFIKYKTDIPAGEILEIPSDQQGEGVYSRDNDLAYPYINYIEEYAWKLTDKIVALNIAAQRLKCPMTFAVNEAEMRDSVKKIAQKIESNDDVIIVVKSSKVVEMDNILKMEPNNMKPEILQSMKDAILFDFNMFLETMGINTNPSPDKSQVVLTPELNSNNNLIDLEFKIRMDNRKKLCEDVKSLLGIEMSVEDNREEAMQMAEKFKQGVMGNEPNGKPNEAR